jgi:hypothetical protein
MAPALLGLKLPSWSAADWGQVLSALFTAIAAFAAWVTVFRFERDRRRSSWPDLHVGRVSCGFLVSWNGFAETIEKQLLRGSEGDLLIVPITGADLRAAVRDDDFASRLRELHERAVLL